jgi:hypothetical protein
VTRRADAVKLSTLDLADLADAIEAAGILPTAGNEQQDTFVAHDLAVAIAQVVEEIAGHAYDLGVETGRRRYPD